MSCDTDSGPTGTATLPDTTGKNAELQVNRAQQKER